jgi:DNA anti-recombination protein RmuC
MNTTTPQPTPETDAEVKNFDAPWLYYVNADFARKLERERDEAREELQQWKMLCAWGGTPEHIDQFIKGQQSRIHQAQDIEETCEQLERERDEARDQLQAMREAIREVFNSFADEDSAWLLDDLQTAALAKLKPFIKP